MDHLCLDQNRNHTYKYWYFSNSFTQWLGLVRSSLRTSSQGCVDGPDPGARGRQGLDWVCPASLDYVSEGALGTTGVAGGGGGFFWQPAARLQAKCSAALLWPVSLFIAALMDSSPHFPSSCCAFVLYLLLLANPSILLDDTFALTWDGVSVT